MAKYKNVEETPLELFSKAEYFIQGIESALKDTKSAEQAKINNVSFCIMQSIENIIKGYIKHNGKSVKQIHSLRELLNIAGNINQYFKNIENKADVLDKFNPSIKYNYKEIIEPIDIKKSLDLLKQIYNQPDITNIREVFKNIVGYVAYKDIEKLNINIENKQYKKMECIIYKILNNNTLFDVIKNASVVTPLADYGSKELMKNGIYIKKSTYVNMQNKNIFVLERIINNNNINSITEVWQFLNDFGKEQAIKFINDWDKRNRGSNKNIKKKKRY